MAKRIAPIITNTEILARAIRSVDAEMETLERISTQIPMETRQQWLDPQLNPLKAKREALNTLYCIETGIDYD